MPVFPKGTETSNCVALSWQRPCNTPEPTSSSELAWPWADGPPGHLPAKQPGTGQLLACVKDSSGEKPQGKTFLLPGQAEKNTGDFVWRTGVGRVGDGHQWGGGNGQFPPVMTPVEPGPRAGGSCWAPFPGSRSRQPHSLGLFSQLCPSSLPVPSLAEAARLCPSMLHLAS